MTYSIGFRIPKKAELARELLQRLAEDAEDELGEVLYKDADQSAVVQPAEIPVAMLAFAQQAVQEALKDHHAVARGLGEYMTEPKPDVWFDALDIDQVTLAGCALRLDRRTRMMFDDQHIFINGETFTAAGRDATLMRLLANQRQLDAVDTKKLSRQAREQVSSWVMAGWLQAVNPQAQ